MTAATMVVQIVGAVLVGAVGLHVVMALVRARSELAMLKEEHQTRAEVLKADLQAATTRKKDKSDLVEGSWSGTRKFRIEKRVEEAQDICSFYLVPHDGKPLAPFFPGQFLTFSLDIPGRPKPLIRCYSLSDAPSERKHYRVSIKKMGPPPRNPELPPGLSSNHFHNNLQERDIVDVKAPSGGFYMSIPERRPVVLIAGGVGITPVFSMLKEACSVGYAQEIWFFYGMRSGVEHAFRAELDAYAAEHSNVKLQYCYSDPVEEDIQKNSFHHQARVSVELFKKVLPSNNYVFYMCGPPPMMESVTKDLADWGVPQADIRLEAFGPASVKKKAESKPESAPSGEKFSVNFARSGKTLDWTGGEDNILEFAEANGVDLDSGCRAGSCGTCLTAVKSGTVDYASPPDHTPEAGSCLACVARPKSDLVLDA